MPTLIFANSQEDLQKFIDIFNEVISAFGLELSYEKSEVMIAKSKFNNDSECILKSGNYTFKNTKCFRYLGSLENSDVNFENEIQIRIS